MRNLSGKSQPKPSWIIEILNVFRATGTLGQQLLYKDITILQLCEAGGMFTYIKNKSYFAFSYLENVLSDVLKKNLIDLIKYR